MRESFSLQDGGGLLTLIVMNHNLNSGYGQLLAMQVAAAVGPNFGQILVVLEDSDNNDLQSSLKEAFVPDPNGRVRFFTTVEAAIDAATSNNNDVILMSAHSSHSISEGITISKSRLNFIGMDGGDRLVQQGTKWSGASDADEAFLVKNTGTRNSFRNIKFIQNSTNAAALTVFQEGGEGTVFKNCSFTFGVADNLDQATAYEFVMGGDSCTFIDCQFGQDTLLTSAARSVMRIDQVNGFECKSNRFRGCHFLISSSEAGAQFITLAAAGDILFTNVFENCVFSASIDSAGGSALTKAVSTPNGTVKGTLYFYQPVVFGAANFGVNGTNNDNIQVYGAANTGTDLHGIAPVAT